MPECAYVNNNVITHISVNTALSWLVAWLSGNTLISINAVTVRWVRLVLGWVTMCEGVNHLGM